ncbi:MAG: hypothetical protein ACXACR_05730, partial [Candidatus Hodarchaeales archaeon]
MSSREKVTESQQFQFRLTIEEWIAQEFERVAIQNEKLLEILDQVRFLGVNGLIQRKNKKVSPFYFHTISEKETVFLLIAFSIPVFQSFDSIAVQTGMEYFSSVLKYVLIEKLAIAEAEVKAFDDIQRINTKYYQKREIIPYKDFTEK